MGTFIARRLLQSLVSLFILMTLVFFLFRLLPADPTAVMVDAAMTPEQVERLRANFGLDKPLLVQYALYLRNVILHGDFGTSFFYRQPVFQVLGDKILSTIILGLATVVISYSLGTLIGALAAWRRGSAFEAGSIAVSLAFRAAPDFWIGMVFVMIFAYRLGWFPHSGMREIGYVATSLWDKYVNLDFLRHLFLPALVGGLANVATPLLLMRNAMLEVVHEEFVELARAKGLPPWRIIYLHAARNALLPVVTSLAVSVGRTIGGIVLVEVVFSWPGLGREIVLAATRYDFPVAQAAFVLIAAVVMLMNLLADLLYAYLDPRIVYR